MFSCIKAHYLTIINFEINALLLIINFISFLKILFTLFFLIFSFILIIVVIFLNNILLFY